MYMYILHVNMFECVCVCVHVMTTNQFPVFGSSDMCILVSLFGDVSCSCSLSELLLYYVIYSDTGHTHTHAHTHTRSLAHTHTHTCARAGSHSRPPITDNTFTPLAPGYIYLFPYLVMYLVPVHCLSFCYM